MSEHSPECCCPSPDGVVCVAIRYNQEIEDVDEPCECYCHFLAERRFGQHEDDFYFDGDDAPDGFDDDGNRHNEMWDSPEQSVNEKRVFLMGKFDESPTNPSSDHQMDATHCLFLGFSHV